MNGYPKVFDLESDPREGPATFGAMYEWVIGPAFKAVEEYKGTLEKIRDPQATNITRF